MQLNMELEVGGPKMSWNPYQCSYENVFDQNFWNCGWLLTQLKQLLAQARERHTWTGIESVKKHKSAPFLTCLFYCWLNFMLKIGRVKKQGALLLDFCSSFLPHSICENILHKSFIKIIPHNSPFTTTVSEVLLSFSLCSSGKWLGWDSAESHNSFPHGRVLHLLRSLNPEQ